MTSQVPTFAAVCVAIAIDLGCSNVAISLLSVALQQARFRAPPPRPLQPHTVLMTTHEHRLSAAPRTRSTHSLIAPRLATHALSCAQRARRCCAPPRRPPRC